MQSGGFDKKVSLLPPEFTSSMCLDVILEYLNYSAFDEGSARHLELLANNESKEAITPLKGAERAKAIRLACEACSEKLFPLDAHLRAHAFVCGNEPGFEDFLRYCLIQHLLFVIAPLWRLDRPLFEACPNLHRWMMELRGRDSNPFQ